MTQPTTASTARHVLGLDSGPDSARAPSPSPVNHTMEVAHAPAAAYQRVGPKLFVTVPSMSTVSR